MKRIGPGRRTRPFSRPLYSASLRPLVVASVPWSDASNPAVLRTYPCLPSVRFLWAFGCLNAHAARLTSDAEGKKQGSTGVENLALAYPIV